MKRLYRCEQGKKICGVCQGIAEYFNVDVTVVRLVAVLMLFCGWGVLAYIICAIIMPEKNEVINNYDINNHDDYQNNNYNGPDIK